MAPPNATSMNGETINGGIVNGNEGGGGGSNSPPTEPVHVVVAGAGPAGLLAAINILRRNDTTGPPKFRVTLVDINQDYGILTASELTFHRSWMIGLSTHGLTAIRQVPDLFEGYVGKCGVRLQSISLHLPRVREFKFNNLEDNPAFGEGYIVDRNYVCAAMARYLNDKFLDTKNLCTKYHSKVVFVDGEKRRVLLRPTKKGGGSDDGSDGANVDGDGDEFLSYDVLIGCDGIRSYVRDALVHTHREFECDVDDTFGKFKAVHVDKPSSIDDRSLHFLQFCMGDVGGIGLPETGNKLNLAFGFRRDQDPPPELRSSDPDIVAEYMKSNFKAFPLEDYHDFATQWVNQNWSTTGQVHCNMYHSSKLGILLMGDAAHATCPNIGQGMNTALEDASVLSRLLECHGDDFTKVLPAFSDERVKEGNALSYMSYYSNSWELKQEVYLQLCQIARSTLSRYFPRFVMAPPQQSMGQGEKLSVVYDRLTQLGYLPAIRETNDRIRREYEEEALGLVTHRGTSAGGKLMKLAVVGTVFGMGVLCAKSRRAR